MREKGDSLIESIARFDIRENQDIGLTVDGRYNAFDVAARLFSGSLYIQRAVDDDVSELACLGKFHNIDIIQRMRELGAPLFRTMDKCDTRLFDTEMVAGMDGIPNHLYALLQSGPGNDCGIRKEQQLIIGGNLHDSQMCQNLSFDRLYEVSNELTELLRDRTGEKPGIPEAMEKVTEVYEMTIEEIKKGLSH